MERINPFRMFSGAKGRIISQQIDTARFLMPVAFDLVDLPYQETGTIALFVVGDKEGVSKPDALQSAFSQIGSVFSRAHARCDTKSGHVIFDLNDPDPVRYRVIEVRVTCSALTEQIKPPLPGELISKDITKGTQVLSLPAMESERGGR